MNEPLEKVLEDLSKTLGTPRSVAFKNNLCVTCSGKAEVFRDMISNKEYTLSGLCQGCQDKIWG